MEKQETSLENQDPELAAMTSIMKAFEKLDEATSARVLSWAAKRFAPKTSGAVLGEKAKAFNEARAPEDIQDLPSLFDVANPTTEGEKALVVGFWCQQVNGQADFAAQAVNTELKHMGHAVSNITAAFNGLIGNKLVLQIRKSGNSKQARKKYKLTLAGVRKVQDMLSLGGQIAEEE